MCLLSNPSPPQICTIKGQNRLRLGQDVSRHNEVCVPGKMPADKDYVGACQWDRLDRDK